jgi:hypothetical protein
MNPSPKGTGRRGKRQYFEPSDRPIKQFYFIEREKVPVSLHKRYTPKR